MKTGYKILIGVVVLLIALRVALPFIVKHYINDVLDDGIEGYTGRVDRVGIALYRGAYTLDSLTLQKLNADVPEPFIDIDQVDLSVEWPALLRGKVVGEVLLKRPRVNFVDGDSEAEQQTGVEGDAESWQTTVDKLFPLQIDRLEIQNGAVRFLNPKSTPKVDLEINQINAVARNLTNAFDSTQTLPSSFDMTALVLGEGEFTLDSRLDVLAEPIALEANIKLEEVDLTRLNDFFEAYVGFDVEQGRMGLYSEVATAENKFEGYIRPILKEVRVLSIEKDKSLLQMAYEGVVEAARAIFTNPSEKQVATQVPISGRLDDPDINIWKTVLNTVRNAFIEAYAPELEGSIDLDKLGLSEAEKRKVRREKED